MDRPSMEQEPASHPRTGDAALKRQAAALRKAGPVEADPEVSPAGADRPAADTNAPDQTTPASAPTDAPGAGLIAALIDHRSGGLDAGELDAGRLDARDPLQDRTFINPGIAEPKTAEAARLPQHARGSSGADQEDTDSAPLIHHPVLLDPVIALFSWAVQAHPGGQGLAYPNPQDQQQDPSQSFNPKPRRSSRQASGHSGRPVSWSWENLAAPSLSPLLNEGTYHFLDATFGRGGHTRALLHAFPQARVIALDRDPAAATCAQSVQKTFGPRFQAIHTPFSCLDRWVEPGSLDGVLMDFGVSSPQLDDPERGFSFQTDGPLDMRMDPSRGPTAADLVNTLDQDALADLLFTYGQEHASRRIARAIAQDRQQVPFTTTRQLAGMLERVLGRRGRIHPATRTFQALRIAVNQELAEIQTALPLAMAALRPGGVLVTIAFHSLEDGLAKRFFKTCPDLDLYSKKPLTPTLQERTANPRARSACLRFGRRKI